MSEYSIETEEVRTYDPAKEAFVGGPWTRFDLVFEERGEKRAIPIAFVGEEEGLWHARPGLVDESKFTSADRLAVETEVRKWARELYQTARA